MILVTCLVTFAMISQSSQLEFSEALNFVNESGSVAVYEPWLAAKTGTLKFNFKTFDPDGLLFYAGDNDDPGKAGNYMYLKLEWGEVVLVTQVHYFTEFHEENKIEEKIKLGHRINDGNWHGVVIERRQAYTTVKVDTKAQTLELADKISNLYITSNLYVGGIPSRYIEHGCVTLEKEMPRFLGCIKDLAYGEGNYVRAHRIIEAQYVDQREMCLDACQPGIKCLNGGLCKNYFLSYKCDCLGTGFDGRHCEKPSMIITLDGLGYVQLENKTNSTSTDVSLSFKTKSRQGIIFGVGDSTSYLVLELVNEMIRVSVKLRTGKKQSLVMKRSRINENHWHYVHLSRRGQEVRLQLDKSMEESKILEAEDDNDEIKDRVYVGGAWNTDKIFPGFTQVKFCGCLRQVFYNGVDLLRYGKHKGGSRKINSCIETTCTKR